MGALLEVENVSKVFELSRSWVDRLAQRPVKRLHALDQVSLEIQAGQVVGLVGESGSGKSTLGRCIVRLYTPETGAIRFDGTDITHLSDQQLLPLRRQIQMIFQNPYSSLNPRLSVRQALAEVLTVHGVDSPAERDQRIHELLERVRLANGLGGSAAGGIFRRAAPADWHRTGDCRQPTPAGR